MHSKMWPLKMNRKKKVAYMVSFAVFLLLTILIAGSCIDESLFVANFAEKRQPPSVSHPFGTDTVGRDMYSGWPQHCWGPRAIGSSHG